MIKSLSWRSLVWLKRWDALVWLIAALIAIPILVVLSQVFVNTGDTWQHLAETVLANYLLNSLWLMLGVGVGVITIGVSTAWLVTNCQFWGVRWWQWLLLTPLAAPAYVLAYTYTEFFAFEGRAQVWLRQITGWQYGDYWFPNVRSLGGAIAMLILVLYPYVFLLARVAFLEQATCSLEASRSLGCGPWRSFWTVALPLARPAIAAGTSLALMETLNDFGTVQYFGVDTFTTGIYRTWFGMGEPIAAAQLASVLVVMVFALLVLEKWSRGKARYYNRGGDRPVPYQLRGWRATVAWLVCALPVFFGLLLPAALLLYLAIAYQQVQLSEEFWRHASHSLLLATLAALLAVGLALLLAYSHRLVPTAAVRWGIQVAAMGYAIPGTVIAVGILIPLGWLDNRINDMTEHLWGVDVGLIFSGTITALIYAYLVRFLAVSLGSVEASLVKIRPCLDEVARTLGRSPFNILRTVHLPLMVPGLFTAGMMVFVDVMKELPATLVIRPFNFDTLAIQVYRFASDERLPEAAISALALVVVGLIPVIWLGRQTRWAE
ncbi:iron ABC transporter permease [Thermosynechococcaceae cyanobacterium Okahandja]